LALASNAVHLRLPHYLDMLGRAGLRPVPGDPAASAAGLVERGAFLYGDADELAARLAEFTDAGVDEVVLNLTGVCARYGTPTALRELEFLVRLVAS
jgi:hypothetical protein